MSAIAPSARQANRFNFRASCRTGLPDVFGFTGGFRNARVGIVFLDVHADLGASEVSLHVRRALGLFHLNALVLRRSLFLEGFDLLISNFTVRQNGNHVFRQDHVLDIHAFCLHLILLELLPDVLERFQLHLLARFDKADCRHALQRVAEMVAHRRLQHFVHQIAHRANHRDHTRRFGVRNVDLHLQVNLEDEALL